MTKQEILNFKPPSSNKYERFGLKQNAFPYVGVPEETISIYVNRKKELKTIEAVIKSSLHGSSCHLALIGGYGNGKTHTLKFIKRQLESQLTDITVIYLSNPGERILNLYSSFMYEFGFERLEKLVWQFLEFVSGEKNLRKKVNEGEILLPEILEIGKRRLLNEVKYTDFATAFLKITLEESKFLAWKYLCGEPIISEYRRELDVVSAIDTDEKALRAFISLKHILSLLGCKLICILIDEFESIVNLHPILKQKILNGIRHLIDLNPKGLCLILGCAPEVWVNIIKEYHAFSDRIFRQITLKALKEKDVRAFVSSYLESFRIKDVDPPTEIYPFTEEAIKEIHKAAEGNIRRILMTCNQAIDAAVENEVSTITGETLKEMLPDLFEFSIES
jgi:type II secretory pathway predicted ATPase ExeA